jgi:thiamine biosynthesis lipoprotein
MKSKIFLSVCLAVSLLMSGCVNRNVPVKYVVAGTYLEITSSDSRAPKIAYDEFKRLEKIFNFYDPASELSRLNNSFDTPIKVSPEMIEILTLSKQVNYLTNGAFDPASGALFDFWKQRIKQKGPIVFPTQDEINRLKDISGIGYVLIDPAAGTVTIKKQGLKIDLGGIAKGYMLDKAAEKLRLAKVSSALLKAGGDIYCLGKNNGNPWRVGIKNPAALEGIMEAEEVEDQGISTSGNYEQFFNYNGKQYGHVIDPVTGFPVDGNIVSVTVISHNATTSDALSTGFFVMGIDGVKRFLAAGQSNMRIFVLTLDENGKERLHVFK